MKIVKCFQIVFLISLFLKFANVKQTAPLTLKFLEGCLSTCIQSPEQVEIIMNYIKENRESKYVSDIKRVFYINSYLLKLIRYYRIGRQNVD